MDMALPVAVAMSQPVPSGGIAALLAVVCGVAVLLVGGVLLAVVISVLKH